MTKRKNNKHGKILRSLRTMLSSKGSQALLLTALCFLGWVFLLPSSVLSYQDRSAALSEITLLSVFRTKFIQADFSSYTFATGMGASIFRLMLCGYGGILTVLTSLLPQKIHSEIVLLLTSLRLSIASGVMCRALRELASSEKEKKLPVLAPAVGLLYGVLALLISLLSGITVADTYIILPILLILYLQILRGKRETVTSGFFLTICAYFLSQATLALLWLPVLILALVFLTRKIQKDSSGKILKHSGAQLALSFGLFAIFLIPQIYQIPAQFFQKDPSAVLLQKLGSDTDAHHTDVTFHSEATSPMLQQNASLFIVGNQASSFDINIQTPTHFQYLNEWIYSLWPSLPSIPFQDTASDLDAAPNPNTRSVTMTTVFIDPLYAAVSLPHRESTVTVAINGRYITEIRNNPGTTLIDLGSYNVGQVLTLTLQSSNPKDLTDAKVEFGYINSLNWNKYTENCTYGIYNQKNSSDGITAESAVAYDSLLLTNIPYDKGWSLYLNGQKTPVTPYEGAWISAPIAQGSYVIHLEYTAPGTLPGGLLTALALLLLAVYYFSKSSPLKSRTT